MQYKNCRYMGIAKVIFFFAGLLLLSCKNYKPKHIFSQIEVDRFNKTISFKAYLNDTPSEKYFIFYFQSYPWIRDYAIFCSSAPLKELQTALALIDWELWNKIYTNKFSPQMEIKILHENQWFLIHEIMKLKNLNTYQTIFWGLPGYDEVVLNDGYYVSRCSGCELLPLEQSLILGTLQPLNYKLIKNLKGKEIKIKIKFN
ncbi:MAG: hypothetical protein ABDH23_05920 [Endomicrobiia bacterium]